MSKTTFLFPNDSTHTLEKYSPQGQEEIKKNQLIEELQKSLFDSNPALASSNGSQAQSLLFMYDAHQAPRAEVMYKNRDIILIDLHSEADKEKIRELLSKGSSSHPVSKGFSSSSQTLSSKEKELSDQVNKLTEQVKILTEEKNELERKLQNTPLTVESSIQTDFTFYAFQETVDKLNTDLSEYQENTNELLEIINELHEKIKTTELASQSKIKKVTDQLEAFKTKNTDQSTQIESLQVATKELQSAIETLEISLAEKSRELTENQNLSKQEIQALQEEQKKLKTELKKTEAELHTVLKQKVLLFENQFILNEQIQKFSNENVALVSDLAKSNQANSALKDVIERLKTRNTTLTNENLKSKETITNLQQEIIKFKYSLQKKEAELKAANELENQYKEQIQMMQEEVESRVHQFIQELKQLTDLQSKLLEKFKINKKNLKDAQSKISTLKNQINELTEELEKQITTHNNDSIKITDLENQLKTLNRQIARKESDVNQLTTEKEDIQERFSLLQKQYEQVAAKNTNLENNLASQIKQSNEQNKKIKNLELEVKRKQKDIVLLRRNLQEGIDTARVRVYKELDGKIQTLEERVSIKENRIAELHKKNKQLDGTNDDQLKRLLENYKETEELEKQIKELKNENKDLKEQIKDLKEDAEKTFSLLRKELNQERTDWLEQNKRLENIRKQLNEKLLGSNFNTIEDAVTGVLEKLQEYGNAIYKLTSEKIAAEDELSKQNQAWEETSTQFFNQLQDEHAKEIERINEEHQIELTQTIEDWKKGAIEFKAQLEERHRQENESLQMENEDLRGHFQRTLDLKETLNQDLQTQLAITQAALEKAQSTLETHKVELATSKQAQETLRAEISDKNVQTQKLETEKANLSSEKNALENQIKENNSTHNANYNQIRSELEEKVDEITKKLNHTDTESKSLRENNEVLKNELEITNKKIKDLTEQNGRLIDAQVALQREKSQLDQQINGLNSKITEAHNRSETISGQSRQLQEDLAAKQIELEEARKALENVKIELENVESLRATSIEIKNATSNVLLQYQEREKQLNTQLITQAATIERQAKEKTELKLELTKAKKELERLQSITSENQKDKEKIKELSEYIGDLESQIEQGITQISPIHTRNLEEQIDKVISKQNLRSARITDPAVLKAFKLSEQLLEIKNLKLENDDLSFTNGSLKNLPKTSILFKSLDYVRHNLKIFTNERLLREYLNKYAPSENQESIQKLLCSFYDELTKSINSNEKLNEVKSKLNKYKFSKKLETEYIEALLSIISNHIIKLIKTSETTFTSPQKRVNGDLATHPTIFKELLIVNYLYKTGKYPELKKISMLLIPTLRYFFNENKKEPIIDSSGAEG